MTPKSALRWAIPLILLVGVAVGALARATSAPPVPMTAGDTVLENGGLKWRSGGKTPVITLQPIALSAEHIAAVDEAMRRWNDTGYVRFVRAPSKPADDGTCYGSSPPCVKVSYSDTVALGNTSRDQDHGIIGGASVRVNPLNGTGADGTVDPETMIVVLTHELGHVLGLGEGANASAATVMGGWRGCPTPLDLALLASRYPRNKGAWTLPAGYNYPLGATCP